MCLGRVLTAVVLLTAARGASITQEALRGHQVWEVSGGLVPQHLVMTGLVDPLDHSGPSRSIRVAPEFASKVKESLHRADLTYRILVHDLSTYLEEEEVREGRSRRDAENITCTCSSCLEPLHSQYMSFCQIERFLADMAQTYPDRINVTSIGKSVEGRDIWLAHLKPTNPLDKSIWVEAGLHAREWISPAVALHLIHRLIHNSSMAGIDAFIIPMANPDGYVYTWTTNRFWRKNRRILASNCDGVDLNRNWDFHFGVGASTDPCSEVYKGPSAFSEPETRALRDAMLKEKDNMVLVLALHSFGQNLLYPWGWSKTVQAPGRDELIATGKVFTFAARKATDVKYNVINSAGDFYFASGATDDWALGMLKTKYAYTLELRDKGTWGFSLPSDNIADCSEEVWQGLNAMVNDIVS
ncbi:carboxypeptidase B-like [Homarus americanus]|uniref:Carboxypeptidase B-like 4 n=1 Tax=Homarus americanus TaxID=6706 RepID=A0A8J5N5F2_HOMAM|nr:carboxypeptidase B-like [Homarus americanus]XP_042214445.1 carboxypeptidase B-like [Homarus americanus]XP_042214446.1 carboxypeptidase B-like [Homarus americanus]XP_042214447.1 carboxypeptidase B-like [Homarus americanus]XP_042214448.1 carboxypeptidase B-like [Homarus americanus]KAG7173138.1 Carboxypeptidase B-like 4 [Homarus americanus]